MNARRAIREGVTSCYHVFSHLCDRHPFWGDGEKEMFRRQLWKTAYSCGIEVLTYAILNNHFHVLLRIPGKIELGDDELLQRYRVLYPKPNKFQAKAIEDYERDLKSGGQAALLAREALLKRMGDLSKFMQLLKQRYSIWFNKTHGRCGTLWSGRFKSVLVEDSVETLKTVGAYIDLNAVRAGLVTDPGVYRFSGFGECMAGQENGVKGLRALFKTEDDEWNLRVYREILFGKGAIPKACDGSGMVLDPEAVRQVLESGGAVSSAERLLCRMRYFRDGCVLGSRGFVTEAIPFLKKTGVSHRKSERTHPVPGFEASGLSSFRDLGKV